jgi:histidine ammonia-lyase
MPTNGDNQDITTMGTIAAWRASRIIERAWDVLAIEQLILAQGIDLVRQQNDRRAFSASSNKLHEDVREHAPFLDEDRPLSDEIALLSRVLAQVPVEDS